MKFYDIADQPENYSRSLTPRIKITPGLTTLGFPQMGIYIPSAPMYLVYISETVDSTQYLGEATSLDEACMMIERAGAGRWDVDAPKPVKGLRGRKMWTLMDSRDKSLLRASIHQEDSMHGHGCLCERCTPREEIAR